MSDSTLVLCLNGGSSSLKLALFHADGANEEKLGSGAVEGIGQGNGRLSLHDAQGKEVCQQPADVSDQAQAVHALFDALGKQSWPTPEAVGHRLVHGGPDHAAPTLVDDALLAELKKLTPYAPLHLPSELAAIDAVKQRYPTLPQVVCFDTAFHRDLPMLAKRLPLPRALFDEGVRRYGFHGLSYEYIVSALGERAGGRLVIAHLGSGASMVAVQERAPIDTTMGMTPTGGIMMATRSGDLDPGVPLHLLRERGYDTEQLARVIEHESGLYGVSGGTADMQKLLATRASDAPADEAVRLFCYLIKKQLGAYFAALGGLDTLVFTGGIGERAAEIRAEVCTGLTRLGIELDEARNRACDPARDAVISRADATCTVRVMETDEERMIARHTAQLVRTRSPV